MIWKLLRAIDKQRTESNAGGRKDGRMRDPEVKLEYVTDIRQEEETAGYFSATRIRLIIANDYSGRIF